MKSDLDLPRETRGWSTTLIVRVLAGVMAAFWLMTGALVATGVGGIGSAEAALPVGLLMVGNGAALACAAWLVLRGRRLVDLGGVLLFAANAVLSVTDQMGMLDLLSLVLSGSLGALVLFGTRSAPKVQSE